MTEEPNAETDQPQADPAIDAGDVAEKVARFESRIVAGDFDDGGFHQAVKRELFPLIGEGALEPSDFARLVDLWAERNHPFDWPLKPYGRLA